MEWLPYVHDAIEYIEANLLTIQNAREVADELSMSEVHLQKGFHIITGFSLAEYIRDRRLYEAAVEIVSTDTGIVDIFGMIITFRALFHLSLAPSVNVTMVSA